MINKRQFARGGRKRFTRRVKSGGCFFCKSKNHPNYGEIENLGRFLSARGKILGRAESGLCKKHQLHLAREIKKARYLALLPFVPKVN